MNHSDALLREKENEESFNLEYMQQHWSKMEKKLDNTIEDPTKRPNPNNRKWVRVLVTSTLFAVVAFIGIKVFKSNKEQKKQIATAIVPKSVITPPIKGVDVPYETFSFLAEVGDTVYTKNGSIIVFPKSAVLDKKGNAAKGSIRVKIREFNDPFDYSIAGIPMQYDSVGIKYNFISSGMIDIKAYQNNELLYVNPSAKPQVNLVSTNKNVNTNLYLLDTITGQWKSKGKDEVNLVNIKKPKRLAKNVENPAPNAMPISIEMNTSVLNDLVKPQMPQKASGNNPIIEILIDPQSFKELMAYNNLRFEVVNMKNEEVANASKVEWENIELKKGNNTGTYIAKFSKGTESVIYTVMPVLEGKDYTAAERLYEQKMDEYNKILQQKIVRDNTISDSVSKMNTLQIIAQQKIKTENKSIEALNVMIEARNKEIEKENARILAINKENKLLMDSTVKAMDLMVEKQNRINDSMQKEATLFLEKQRLEWEKQQEVWEQNNKTLALNQNLIRSFEIDGFGIWNCDQPTLPSTIQFVGSFRNDDDKNISFEKVILVADGINRIMQFYNNNIALLDDKKYYGWAYGTNSFYYFRKEEYSKAITTENPNTIIIKMKKYDGVPKSYKELKKVVMQNEYL